MKYKNLIDQAREAGKNNVFVAALIEKDNGMIFLAHESHSNTLAYELPRALVKKEESISQAIQRGVMETTGMEIDVVKEYLGEQDLGKDRHYFFVVKVKDPELAGKISSIEFTWAELQESFGYPITDNLREMLDFYAKKRGF